jgi:hypothetical protein
MTTDETLLSVTAGIALCVGDTQTLNGNTDTIETGNASVLRLSFEGPYGISGFDGGTDGRVLLVINVNPHQTFWLIDQTRSASDPAHRIIIPKGGPWPVEPNRTAMLWYDSTDSRWRVVSLQ